MWNALIDKTQSQCRVRPPSRMFSKTEVTPNETGICCLDNEHVVRIDAGMPGDRGNPIHAHHTRPQSPDIEPGKVVYAAGQSPHAGSFKDFLAQALASKQGVFEIVSRKAHYDAEQSTRKSIIDLLKMEIAKPRDSNSDLMFGNRYKYQSLNQVAGKGHAQDAEDFVHYELTVIDPDGTTIKIPLTQAGLKFTDRVLQPEQIRRADSLLDTHQDAVASGADADRTDSPKVQLILSRAGAGRNATLISYRKIARLIEYRQVTEATLDVALEEEIHAGRMRRGPGYVHSIEQLASLRTALLEKIAAMPPLTAPGIAAPLRRRSAPTWLNQTVSNARPISPLHQTTARQSPVSLDATTALPVQNIGRNDDAITEPNHDLEHQVLPNQAELGVAAEGKQVATPATGAAQQAQPSGNADAETIPARPASPFSQLNFDQKIQALLDAADNQINQVTAYNAGFCDLEGTQISSSNLTAKECLGFALEIGLEERRAQVPDISLRLTRILNAEDQIIPLFGVNFPRARIEAWSREESLPEPVQVHQEFIDKDNALGTAFAENVHGDPVKAVGKKQLNVMKNRTAIGSQKTVEQTATEIRQYIATLPSSEDALKGLNKIIEYTGGEFNDDASPFLAIVWGYIEQFSNQEMKQNLRDSMIIKLAEIATENPCSDGIIERIIDIPTAIDLSLPQDIPEEEVLTELAQMVGHTNELFEENYVFDCAGARAAAGDDATSPARIAVEATIRELKRNMFLARARIELVVLRDIDSNFVTETADKVFPKAAIIQPSVSLHAATALPIQNNGRNDDAMTEPNHDLEHQVLPNIATVNFVDPMQRHAHFQPEQSASTTYGEKVGIAPLAQSDGSVIHDGPNNPARRTRYTNNEIDMAKADLLLSGAGIGMCYERKLAADDGGSWWRAAFIAVLLEHATMSTNKTEDAAGRIAERVRALGPDFIEEAELLKRMMLQLTNKYGKLESPDGRGIGIRGFMTDLQLPMEGKASSAEGLIIENGFSRLKAVGEKDDDPDRPGEKALKKIAHAMLVKAGFSVATVDNLFNEDAKVEGTQEHIVELMNQLGAREGFVLTRPWVQPDPNSSGYPWLDFESATLDIHQMNDPLGEVIDGNTGTQEGDETENLIYTHANKPVIVAAHGHFSILIESNEATGGGAYEI